MKRWNHAPACEGTAHRDGTKGHDVGPAAWVVHMRCACGLRGVMLLCDGRVSHVLSTGEMTCGACGATSPARSFWERIEPITDPGLDEDAIAADLIDAWASELRARGCRPKSVKGMVSTMRTFARKRTSSLLDVTREQIIDYLATDGWAPHTRRTYRTTLATFYDWLTISGRVSVNPAGRLPRTRIPYSEPHPLTTEQIERLLNSGIRRRTRMMILLGAYQGLRVSEIAAVHGRDVVSGLLHIPEGKGGTSLRRPLHPLILEFAHTFPTDDYWFPGIGNPHVSGAAISQTISAAMKRAGIDGHRPHQLRAWHATELIRSGVDAVTVQHSMRHATLGTLHKYVHPDATDIASALDRLPRVTLTGGAGTAL